MKIKEVFEQSHKLIEQTDPLMQELYELVPDPEESYLNTIAYNLNIGHRWLKELRENLWEYNKESLDQEIKIKIDKEPSKDEEVEVILDDSEELITEEVETKEDTLDSKLYQLKKHLNEIGNEYNKALFILIANECALHSFISNLVNQYIKEAAFALEFEQSRLGDYNK